MTPPKAYEIYSKANMARVFKEAGWKCMNCGDGDKALSTTIWNKLKIIIACQDCFDPEDTFANWCYEDEVNKKLPCKTDWAKIDQENSDFGTILEREKWLNNRIELDSKRYEIASIIYSHCTLVNGREEIEESLRIIERDAESTEEFNKIKQKLRGLINEIGNLRRGLEEDYEEASRVHDLRFDDDDGISWAMDFDHESYDTSGCEAEIASILGLKIDEGVDLPF